MTNRHPGVLSLSASLLLLASLAGGCATPPDGSASTSFSAQAQYQPAFDEVVADLHQHQAAVASAFLARIDELTVIDQFSENPDHAVQFEVAARHILARANEYFSRSGVQPLSVSPREAEAVRNAEPLRLKTEFASQAIFLQRELVREERRSAVEGNIDIRLSGTASSDLEMLLSLSNTTISIPYSGASEKSAAGPSVPTIGGAGGAPIGPGPSQAQAGGNAPEDDASKRRGFASHPGYVPPQK